MLLPNNAEPKVIIIILCSILNIIIINNELNEFNINILKCFKSN